MDIRRRALPALFGQFRQNQRDRDAVPQADAYGMLPTDKTSVAYFAHVALPHLRRRDRRTALLLLLGLTTLYFLTSLSPIATPATSAESVLAVTQSLAEGDGGRIDNQLDLTVARATPNEYLSVSYVRGHYYSDQPPGVAFAAVPFYTIGRALGGLGFAATLAEGGAGGVLFLMALLGGGAMALLYIAARRAGFRPVSARFGVLLVALTSPAWHAATHVGAAAGTLFLLAAALVLALPPLPSEVATDAPMPTQRAALARLALLGLCAGALVTVDWVNVVWLPIIIFLVLRLWSFAPVRKAVRDGGWVLAILGFLGGLAPLLAYNGQVSDTLLGRLLGSHTLSQQFNFAFGNIGALLFGQSGIERGALLLSLATWVGAPGLYLVWRQRGKKSLSLSFVLFIGISLVIAVARQPYGDTVARADWAMAALLPLAFGAAAIDQWVAVVFRFEVWWAAPGLLILAGFAYFCDPVGGIGHIFNAAPGNNLTFWESVLPGLPLWAIGLTLLGLVGGLYAAAVVLLARRAFRARTVAIGYSLPVLLIAVFGVVLFATNDSPVAVATIGASGSDLLAPAQPANAAARSTGVDPAALVRIQVQPGHAYLLRVASEAPITWRWRSENHTVLSVGTTAGDNQTQAAPPAAVYLELDTGTLDLTKIAPHLYDSGVRAEPMAGFNRAALAFTFDWESAMGGPIHSPGGSTGLSDSTFGNNDGQTDLSDATVQKVVATATQRGLDMRNGADTLLRMFDQYGIKATFYATGYNLLDGNTARQTFAGNPTYAWAQSKPKGDWNNNYWATHAWFGLDPYGTSKTDPAWYFGDQTDVLLRDGQDIESHTFGHIVVRVANDDQFRADMAEWVKAARAKNVAPLRSFAFPWTLSGSIKSLSGIDNAYKTLADLGVTVVTRLWPVDQLCQLGDKGADHCLWYLNRVPGEQGETNLKGAGGQTGLLVYPDYILEVCPVTGLDQFTRGKKPTCDKTTPVAERVQHAEDDAQALIEEAVTRRGYVSFWQHPEAMAEAGITELWQNVIAYAAAARVRGLWVAPLPDIVQHRADMAKVGTTLTWLDGNHARLTLRNRSGHTITDASFSLPRPLKNVTGALATIQNSRFNLPTLPQDATVTLAVTFG